MEVAYSTSTLKTVTQRIQGFMYTISITIHQHALSMAVDTDTAQY